MKNYNQKKYLLGQENKKKAEPAVVAKSPYQDIVNCILGMDDIGKKYQCVLDLVNSDLFVRDALPDEDARWYYCKVSNVRLLPTFFYEIAKNYNPMDPKSTKYLTAVARVEKTNGKREGDRIIDKFSGYSISKIAFVSESWMGEGGGEEGGGGEEAQQLLRMEEQMASDPTTVNSGEIIDVNIQSEGVGEGGEEEGEGGEEEGEGGEEEKEEEEIIEIKEEDEIMLNIITHYENSLSILLKYKDKRFIVETIRLLLPSKKTREQYETEKKTTVEYDAYEKTYNQYLIFYSMALIIIVIQTSIPQIKSKTTFPNCVKSFGGYPGGSETDLSFIIYMSCIAQKTKSDFAPWNSIKKINQDKMRDTLFNLIKTKIINQPQIQSRVELKRDYDASKQTQLLQQQSSKYASKTNIASSHFRPLLVDPSILIVSTPIPVTKTYCDDLKRNLKNGSNLQTEKILVLQSKIIHFSLTVQKLIQEIISSQTKDKSTLLSKNYIQNACCNEREREDGGGTITTILDYMIKQNPNIKNYCDMVECTTAILLDVHSLSEASIMLDPKDTRIVFPELSTNFDESTIYNAFMTYCNYGNSGNSRNSRDAELLGDIHKICKFKNTFGENREIFNMLKSAQDLDHSKKIEMINKIKNEFNIDYTIKDLQHLLQLINRQTMKPMNEARVGTYAENLNRILLKASEDFKTKKQKSGSAGTAGTTAESIIFPEDFIIALKNYNEHRTQPHSRDLQKIIEKNTKILTEKSTTFLNLKKKTTINSIFRTSEDVADGILTNGGIMLFSKTENTLLNGVNNSLEVSVEFVKNAIKNLTQVYPNIIFSQIPEMESLPLYISGQLSSGDKTSIIRFSNERITDALNNFYKIGNKKPISTILKNVQASTLLLNEVAANTPIYDGESKHITVLLYEYYFLLAVHSYVYLSDLVKQKQSRTNKMESKKQIDVQKEISKLLATCFELIIEDKKMINKNIETVRENYLRTIDEERDDIVQNVDKMSEDQKEIYLYHKKYKMGSQSIGKNTGLRIYNPDFETEELARIERINARKKERGFTALSTDPEAQAREYSVEDEGDAPDYDPDNENELQEDDGQEEYANSAELYPDSSITLEDLEDE